jgi:hypothetical protein
MKLSMKDYLKKLKDVFHHRSQRDTIIGVSIIGAVVLVISVAIVLIYNAIPKVVYTPASACDLFTEQDARQILGDKALKSNESPGVQSNNVSLSRCGYTNGTGDVSSLVVAAVVVRSGVNDNGVEQNKNEFNDGRPNTGTETITDLGDSAYFNKRNGQLNVLEGKNWIVISYGVGSDPQSNKIEDAVQLARNVVAK